MENFERVYQALGLPRAALDVALGKVKLPLADASAPWSLYGFPPALIPIYSESSGPSYVGFWRHHLVGRVSTVVRLSVEAGYRAREIARSVEQLFAYVAVAAIGISDGVTPEIERFAAGVGIRDLAALDRLSMEFGDNMLLLRGHAPFDRECPLSSFADPYNYDGSFPCIASLDRPVELRSICVLEVERDLQHVIASRPDAPPWFTTRDQSATCHSLIEAGDFGGAWMSLNSPGWRFADAKRALRTLANKASTPDLSVIADAWIAEQHEHAGGY